MYEHSDNKVIMGIDIGGSHVTSALIEAGSGVLVEDSVVRNRVEKDGASDVILNQWLTAMRQSLATMPQANLKGIGFAMPGPFNYNEGICLMQGVNKYQSLYNLNVSEFIRTEFELDSTFPIKFENDASCFGLGESLLPETCMHEKVIAITLGTGFGATFLQHNRVLKSGADLPPGGELYNHPYLDGIAEDYISTAWLLNTYNNNNPQPAKEVKEIAERASLKNDTKAQEVFKSFGEHIAACLLPWIQKFKPGCVVIGGSIAKSSALFIKALEHGIATNHLQVEIKISTLMEISALTGAASLIENDQLKATNNTQEWRKTTQALMPMEVTDAEVEGYNMYPFHNIGDNMIFSGYHSLAQWIAGHKNIAIDGYGGNDWKAISRALGKHLQKTGKKIQWFFTDDFLKPVPEIDKLVAPFLGEADSVWGTRTTLSLADFYDVEKFSAIPNSSIDAISIVIGTGAALAGWDDLIYIDLPKNEIQYRMRAGSTTNLGNPNIEAPATMYKRFYFVDWVVYNRHRQQISNNIKVIADGQWKDNITWGKATGITAGLTAVSHDVIRARPWFEAGAWGGEWMKNNIPQINTNEINYAWSFELIAPENGLVLESDSNLLELSFDWIMELQTKEMLGKDADRFGAEFPIRFDFLDTFEGGNLSIQCHPSVKYIQENFGENITQDETYYILDCKDDAKVYLGFQQDINPGEFKEALEESVNRNEAIDIEKYVQALPAQKHDLFLIPNGTIHSAGVNNMVLEISATPYIFTFKMYDWVRLDLEGKPRPINIEHAFNNLNFDRKGNRVQEELISKQTLVAKDGDKQVISLSTHAEHFYKVERLEFTTMAKEVTNNQCHVLMLVEGSSITVTTKNGKPVKFHYAETFIIPAAATSYEIQNNGPGIAKVIKAFIK